MLVRSGHPPKVERRAPGRAGTSPPAGPRTTQPPTPRPMRQAASAASAAAATTWASVPFQPGTPALRASTAPVVTTGGAGGDGSMQAPPSRGPTGQAAAAGAPGARAIYASQTGVSTQRPPQQSGAKSAEPNHFYHSQAEAPNRSRDGAFPTRKLVHHQHNPLHTSARPQTQHAPRLPPPTVTDANGYALSARTHRANSFQRRHRPSSYQGPDAHHAYQEIPGLKRGDVPSDLYTSHQLSPQLQQTVNANVYSSMQQPKQNDNLFRSRPRSSASQRQPVPVPKPQRDETMEARLLNSQLHPVVTELENFYRIYAPTRVSSAHEIARLFGFAKASAAAVPSPNLDSLNQALMKKYGANLASFRSELPKAPRLMLQTVQQEPEVKVESTPGSTTPRTTQQLTATSQPLQKLILKPSESGTVRVTKPANNISKLHTKVIREQTTAQDAHEDKQAFFKGLCGVCQLDVTSNQDRSNDGESYYHKNCWNELVQSVENAKLQMRKPLEPEKENADLQHLPPPPTLIKQSLAASKPRRYSQQIESRLRNSFGHMAIEEGNEASSPANSPQKRPQPIAE